MFRMWGKTVRNHHTLQDTVVEFPYDRRSRTQKVFDALDEICRRFDLAHPIWLDVNIEEFQRRSKVRFTQDSFVETLDFDYLEMQIIEEDY